MMRGWGEEGHAWSHRGKNGLHGHTGGKKGLHGRTGGKNGLHSHTTDNNGLLGHTGLAWPGQAKGTCLTLGACLVVGACLTLGACLVAGWMHDIGCMPSSWVHPWHCMVLNMASRISRKQTHSQAARLSLAVKIRWKDSVWGSLGPVGPPWSPLGPCGPFNAALA